MTSAIECSIGLYGLQRQGGLRIFEAEPSLLVSNETVINCGGHLGQGVSDLTVQNSRRVPGRPRSFDERQALEKAIRVFRSKGYDGVTIDDLVVGMGVGRPSLYSVFGDKRAIFLRALRAYGEEKGAGAAKALFAPTMVRVSLTGFLRHAVETATEEGSAPGCLIICVAPLVSDPEVRQFAQDAAAAATAQVERRLRDGIREGELPDNFPASVRAIQIMDLGRGLTMRAQMGAPRRMLVRDAEDAVDLVLPPAGSTTPGG